MESDGSGRVRKIQDVEQRLRREDAGVVAGSLAEPEGMSERAARIVVATVTRRERAIERPQRGVSLVAQARLAQRDERLAELTSSA